MVIIIHILSFVIADVGIPLEESNEEVRITY